MERNIKIAYLLTICKNSWFWLGVWVFYYLLFTDYAGIGLIETALIVSMTVSEIPTGAIADLVGKKITLAISFLLQAVGIYIAAFSPNVTFLALGVFIAGIGASFYSGTFEALIYDSLKELKKDSRYDAVISKVNAIGLVTPAICCVIGGYLYLIQPNLTFLMNAVFYTIGLFLTFFLVEPSIDTEKFSLVNFFKQTQYGLIELFKNRDIVNQTILLISVGLIVVICDEMLNSFVGVEIGYNPTQLAVLWSVMYLFGALASHATPYIKKFFPYKIATFIVGVGMAVTLVISPFVGILIGGLTLILRYGLQAIYHNLASILINEQTESRFRATTLSTFNLLRNIPYVLSAYLLGTLATHYSAIILATTLGCILFFLVFLQVLIYLYSNKVRS